MKVAYFAESPADEAALKILTEAILGKQTEQITHAGLRHRGWPTVRTVLRPVLLELHYHTDAEGFVFIVDSNGSPAHLTAHANAPDPQCRLCQLQRIISTVRQQVRPVPNRQPLKIALGLAVPAIEAWLLCGVDPHVTEAAWFNGMKTGQMPYTRPALKEKVYGTSHPSLPIETEAMKAAATRLAADLSGLRNLFPMGFRNLESDLNSW
jgi:hypothetical protein